MINNLQEVPPLTPPGGQTIYVHCVRLSVKTSLQNSPAVSFVVVLGPSIGRPETTQNCISIIIPSIHPSHPGLGKEPRYAHTLSRTSGTLTKSQQNAMAQH